MYGDIERMTPIQSAGFIEREYVGKWLYFEATIYAVYLQEDSGVLDFRDGSVDVRVIVSKVERSKLENLHKGRNVLVDAKFNKIMDKFVSFSDGEVKIR